MFSEYGWGGYLIWKMPGKKTFVDGRMPSWREIGEDSGWVFRDYLKMVRGDKDFRPDFEKYGVGVVLWPREWENKALWGIKMSWLKPNPKKGFLVRLEEAGWKKVYEDGVAVIMVGNAN